MCNSSVKTQKKSTCYLPVAFLATVFFIFIVNHNAYADVIDADTVTTLQEKDKALTQQLANKSQTEIRIQGQVLGAGKPIQQSLITLWTASQAGQKQLANTTSDNNGHFEIASDSEIAADEIIYLTAKGGIASADQNDGKNDAIELILVLGDIPNHKVIINELTTIASVWTSAQFLNDKNIQGNTSGLKIAAANVPNLVNIETGLYGDTLLSPLNGAQTAIMARFGTLGNILAGCISRVEATACNSLFDLIATKYNVTVSDTLQAAEVIAKNSGVKPEQLFNLFHQFYPIVNKAKARPSPYLPYLSYPPTSWTLGLVFNGGGLSAPGAVSIDDEGNIWSTNNFIPGSQSGLVGTTLGAVGASKLASDGTPISPSPLGFTGAGVDGSGIGVAIDKQGRVWVGSLRGKTIALYEGKTGKPLSPDTGYTLDGKLGGIQGIIATPDNNIWALDNSNSQVIYIPNANIDEAQIYCQSANNKPVNGNCQVEKPFDIAIDNQKRLWITNAGNATVTRFSESAPAQADFFKIGYGAKEIAVDSQGNAWTANLLGFWDAKISKDANAETFLQEEWAQGLNMKQGNVSFIRSDANSGESISYTGRGMEGPWGIAVDGKDNIWVADFIAESIIQMCGTNTNNCPADKKTGDIISPEFTGYNLGGGLQRPTDLAIDSAGNVWATNNWEKQKTCFAKYPPEANSTHCGGNGLVVIYGIAAPVATPQYGPPRQP